MPAIEVVPAKVAGEKHPAGQKPAAWFAGGSGVALLFLSVAHCSQSIAALTGSPVAPALPMGVGIDCGLIACGSRSSARTAGKQGQRHHAPM